MTRKPLKETLRSKLEEDKLDMKNEIIREIRKMRIEEHVEYSSTMNEAVTRIEEAIKTNNRNLFLLKEEVKDLIVSVLFLSLMVKNESKKFKQFYTFAHPVFMTVALIILILLVSFFKL